VADVIFLAAIVAFFVVAVGLVMACDRIIGADEAVAETLDPVASEELAA
jgi:hypothetical protein